ncbi:hypothetical protein EVAR_40134_1 [Eumeta japonica]|uniref:Uncharacterized protein n=1 Tax=Eumeta variegata TaxID=151549 RepID=A0A4C1W891_EUMVA|nr:hypothetical protein EVAR_40134_1 [Eumeta japonica]
MTVSAVLLTEGLYGLDRARSGTARGHQQWGVWFLALCGGLIRVGIERAFAYIVEVQVSTLTEGFEDRFFHLNRTTSETASIGTCHRAQTGLCARVQQRSRLGLRQQYVLKFLNRVTRLGGTRSGVRTVPA